MKQTRPPPRKGSKDPPPDQETKMGRSGVPEAPCLKKLQLDSLPNPQWKKVD